MSKGFHLLAPEDIAGYQYGRLTLQDLAAKAGISKQAISRGLHRRGIVRAASPPEAPTASPEAVVATIGPSATAPVEATPAHLRAIPAANEGFSDDDVRRLAVSASYLAIRRAHAMLGDSASLGASAIKALMTSLTIAVSELKGLGVLDDEAAIVPEIKIRIMSDGEGATLKAKTNGKSSDPTLDQDQGVK
ncbi:MAG: hypothetical protein HYR63_12015 [Proteobacteria bacterium]|nr:hypothetical protein [Pseudomonadota bacterium]MBI3498512.1 hypothetical protein [Pseudomonadota bacterium]